MLAEYAYVLKVGGIVYTVTDVKDLHLWMVKHLDDHPLFKKLDMDDLKDDPCISCVMEDTEEGKKVARNKGDKYLACYAKEANFFLIYIDFALSGTLQSSITPISRHWGVMQNLKISASVLAFFTPRDQ